MRRVLRLFEVARYAVSAALVNFWRHRTMSLAAVFAAVVMMLMLNGFLIVVSNLNTAMRALEQKVNLIAYLKDDTSSDDGQRLAEKLRADPLVLEVTYLSKDDAMARLK